MKYVSKIVLKIIPVSRDSNKSGSRLPIIIHEKYKEKYKNKIKKIKNNNNLTKLKRFFYTSNYYILP